MSTRDTDGVGDCQRGLGAGVGLRVVPASSDVRCTCGRLLLRRTPSGLEIRCGRCKRQLSFSWEGEPQRG